MLIFRLRGEANMQAARHFNGIESLDHPVIAARDLDAARDTYERLGFTIPPLGSHVEWGPGNLCIMFPDDYLEIRGFVDLSRFTRTSCPKRPSYGLLSSQFAWRQ